MTELKDSEAVGVVREYFRKISVAAVEVLRGRLKVGDHVRFRGFTTDFTQKIESMQRDHVDVPEAGKGDLIGIQVTERVRENDRLYLEGGAMEVSL